MANKIVRLFYLENSPEDKYVTLDEARKVAYSLVKKHKNIAKVDVVGDRIEVTKSGKTKIVRKKEHIGSVRSFEVSEKGKVVNKVVWDIGYSSFMPWLTAKGTIAKISMNESVARWEKLRNLF